MDGGSLALRTRERKLSLAYRDALCEMLPGFYNRSAGMKKARQHDVAEPCSYRVSNDPPNTAGAARWATACVMALAYEAVDLSVVVLFLQSGAKNVAERSARVAGAKLSDSLFLVRHLHGFDREGEATAALIDLGDRCIDLFAD